MTVERIALAQQRVAASRQALVHQMDGNRRAHAPGAGDRDAAYAAEPAGGGWWPTVKRAAATWWYRHPLHTAYEIAEPTLAVEARKRPFRLVGIALAVGAATAVLRPWRLFSLGAIAALAVRPSDLAGIAASMLLPTAPTPRKEP